MENGARQAGAKRLKTREHLWPGAGSLVFDPRDRSTRGYSQVPRVVPLVARLINEIGGSENAGSLYQVLWSQDWGQGIVEVRSFRGLLYEAGYSGKGPRVERTWNERIRILEEHGFVKTKARGLDAHAFVLLIDPHLAVLTLTSTAEGLVPSHWLEQFNLVCEQWGIDVEGYKARAVALASAGAV